MKGIRLLMLVLMAGSLGSCNTAIGLYRDTKQAVIWTKDRIQGSGGGGGGEADSYGDPVY